MRRFRRPACPGGAPTRADDELSLEPAAVAEMTDVTFFESLNGHATVVDLWAPWCAPCQALAPILDGVARQHASGRLHFMRVNDDDNPNVAAGLAVMSILSIVVFDSTGCEIDRLVGLPSLHRLDAHATTTAGSDRSGS